MNRFIQMYYDSKQPDNYDNYMNHPILPFERALAPVSSYNDQFDHYINMAKSSCRTSSAIKLNKDELAAIYLYIVERSKQNLHQMLNHALYSGHYSLMRPWFGFLKLFTTALEKLPSVKDTIWRGIHSNIIKYYRENEEITWWSISSCSCSVSLIRSRLDENTILCSIKSLNGKKIREFAYDTTEDEVLLLPGTRLRVKSNKLDRSTGKHIVDLEEISNDSPNVSTSTSSFLSSEFKTPPHQSRPDNPTTSYISTAYTTMGEPSAKTYEKDSKTKKIFSATTFTNGDRYEVAYENGKKLDYGIYFYNNGQIEEGIFANSRAKGNGTRTWQNGDRYEGNFSYGQMYGFGTMHYADGCVYEGDWIADEAYGKGKSIWPNGNHYEGDHEKGKIQGRGTFRSLKGDKYKGELIDGKAHGRGVRYWVNGDRYEGDFKDDKKYGYGTYSHSDGGKYIGDWVYDEMDGYGNLSWPSGTQYQGRFKNGRKHGRGKLTFANGQVRDGIWENDKFIG